MNQNPTATHTSASDAALNAGITTGMARELAADVGVCVRPLLRTVTDRATAQTWTVPIACGSTRESKCPPCAAKARRLRAHQCAEGWHLTEDPLPPPPAPLDDLPALDDTADETDDQDQADDDAETTDRRTRSTRRRHDVPDLPRVPAEHRSIGTAFTTPAGKTYRPSMFVTLTLGSYGRVIPGRGVPVDPDSYDYRRAALDALHLPKLFDRWVQNLRRCAGYKVQYFAALEPQRRLAPHLHLAIRGAIPREILRAVTSATYAAVWWPPHDVAVYDPEQTENPDRLPWWDGEVRGYRCPDSGWLLPTWGQALDALDEDPNARPAHVVRFGAQADVKGIVAPSADADRAVRYLTKYLTKSISTTYADPDTFDAAYEDHIDRLHEQTRWLPCSPTCANWLRYGVTPKDPGPGLRPGHCEAPAHDRENLGVGGRRCLVSRAWSGKTLAAHKADRAAVVRETLAAAGIEAPDTQRCAADVLDSDGQPRFVWADVPVSTADYSGVILASITEHRRRREEYEHAKALAQQREPTACPVETRSATTDEGRAA